jgi:hypothetical protein
MTTTPVSSNIPTSSAPDAAISKRRRRILCSALLIAVLANALVPAVLFSATRFFGHTDARYRALVAVVVVAEYAIALLFILVHANVGFASGYAVATAAVVTLGSAALTFVTVYIARWGGSAPFAAIVLGGFAFAVLSNLAFFVASIRYARAIHPRLHLGGFFFGIATSLAVMFLYVRLFR